LTRESVRAAACKYTGQSGRTLPQNCPIQDDPETGMDSSTR
jgi:hypothetical protein